MSVSTAINLGRAEWSAEMDTDSLEDPYRYNYLL